MAIRRLQPRKVRAFMEAIESMMGDDPDDPGPLRASGQPGHLARLAEH